MNHASPTSPATADESPEAPALWRIDEVTRHRARAGIALARAALRESLERRASLPGADETGEAADATDHQERAA